MADYGTDLLCLDDLDAQARNVSGPELVAQDLYHDLTEPPGSLIEAPDGSIDVRSFLQTRRGPDDLAQVEDQIRAILIADERIAEARVTAVIDVSAQKITVTAKGRLVDGGEPFNWVFELTETTVTRILQGVQ